MTTFLSALILLWSIFGVVRFNHDYKRPIVISRWTDLFLRYGPVMYLICVALYVAHSTIKWRSEDRPQNPALHHAPPSTLSLTRADGSV